jgi:phosphoribosyl-AMP cyclohydrolase
VLTPDQRGRLRFDDRGLIPTVVQQYDSGEVLMVAWMNEAALRQTLDVGETVFYSRSRQELWHKGATSGNTQRVVDVRVECDGDVLLVLVDQGGDGVACHLGERSCFHRRLPGAPGEAAGAAPPLAGQQRPRSAERQRPPSADQQPT